MLKVTKVQPIATHRDYTRKDKGNFQEIYGKTQENYGIHADSIVLMKRIGIARGVAEFLLRGLVDHDKC